MTLCSFLLQALVSTLGDLTVPSAHMPASGENPVSKKDGRSGGRRLLGGLGSLNVMKRVAKRGAEPSEGARPRARASSRACTRSWATMATKVWACVYGHVSEYVSGMGTASYCP